MQLLSKSKCKPYLYILPSLVIMGFVVFYPLARLVFYSFTSWTGREYSFIGLENYVEILSMLKFWKIVSHNVMLLAIIPGEVILGLIISALLYERIVGWRIFQSIFFLPVILAAVVWGLVWTFIYSLDGPVNMLLESIGLNNLTRLWLGNIKTVLPAVILTMIFKNFGFAVILFLARMSTIDPALYDAAKVDGASRLQILTHVTIPQLRGIIEVYIVLDAIWVFNGVFPYILIMTAGGPGYSTTVMEYFIYTKAFQEFRMGYASCVAVILFIFILGLVLLQAKFLGREEAT